MQRVVWKYEIKSQAIGIEDRWIKNVRAGEVFYCEDNKLFEIKQIVA
jgi:hypothetical protein